MYSHHLATGPVRGQKCNHRMARGGLGACAPKFEFTGVSAAKIKNCPMHETKRLEGRVGRDQDRSAVTVIVCTRERPLQLEHCLRELTRQSYPRFDILVVDNAST